MASLSGNLSAHRVGEPTARSAACRAGISPPFIQAQRALNRARRAGLTPRSNHSSPSTSFVHNPPALSSSGFRSADHFSSEDAPSASYNGPNSPSSVSTSPAFVFGEIHRHAGLGGGWADTQIPEDNPVVESVQRGLRSVSVLTIYAVVRL